ncbi:MAG TPA: M28 family peptidase, partial [Caulobacteraceae bacterium]
MLAWAASRTPLPLPAHAPALQFSAGRAFADIQAIGVKPHPSGSAEHDRVRDYLVGRCKTMGLETHIQSGQSVSREVYPKSVFIEGGDAQDVVCVLPGRDRSAPAIALMAHYDTVAGSPGAADDSANIAAALEIARAVQVSGPRTRDLVLMLSDGEEGGYIGARLFFATDPLARRIGAVINMESEGSGGRALMFETGQRDGGMVGLFQRTAVNPSASSLAGYVYAHMPNGTDFTVARDLGYPGFNFAFVGDQFDYHSPSSTPATLQLGSVQHMGEQALSATRGLISAAKLPRKSADAVYNDLLGGPVIAYPALVGWLFLFADAALLYYAFRRAFRDEPFGWFSAVRGAAAIALILPVAGILLYLLRRGTGAAFTFAEEKALLANFGLYEVGLATACLAGVLLTFLFVGIGRTRFWSAFAGG